MKEEARRLGGQEKRPPRTEWAGMADWVEAVVKKERIEKGGPKGKENKQGVSQGPSGPEGPTESSLWMIVNVVRVEETGGGSQRPSGPE